MSIEIMKQALEAMEKHGTFYLRHEHAYKKAITALRQAIEQAEKQEPVAQYSDIVSDGGLDPRNTTPVHASDIPQERVDETAKDRHEYWCASLTQMLLCNPPKRAPCDCKPPKPSETKPAKEECWACGCFRCVCDKSVPKPKRKPLVFGLNDDGQFTFSVGFQTFTLDYCPENGAKMEFMKKQLTHAIEAAHGITGETK